MRRRINVDIVALVRQQNRLRGDDLQVVVNASLVAIRKQLQRFLNERGGLLLFLVPRARGCTQCGKIVFYFLKGSKGSLPIRSHGPVIPPGRRLGDRSGGTSGIEDRLRHLRPYRPYTAGPIEPVGDRGRLKSAGGAKDQGWKERSAGDAYLIVRLRDPALTGGDVGSALEKICR